jgi:hypothetical protein
MADQTVVVATTLTLIQAGHAALWPGGLYLALYTVVVLFAMARNALAVPYSWLVRPRFVVFLWIPVEMFWWPGSLDYLLWVAAGLLGGKAITGFVRIRKKI